MQWIVSNSCVVNDLIYRKCTLAFDASETEYVNELEKELPHGQSMLDEPCEEMDLLIEITDYLAWHQENLTWALA